VILGIWRELLADDGDKNPCGWVAGVSREIARVKYPGGSWLRVLASTFAACCFSWGKYTACGNFFGRPTNAFHRVAVCSDGWSTILSLDFRLNRILVHLLKMLLELI
jgi:hypothetical protein